MLILTSADTTSATVERAPCATLTERASTTESSEQTGTRASKKDGSMDEERVEARSVLPLTVLTCHN